MLLGDSVVCFKAKAIWEPRSSIQKLKGVKKESLASISQELYNQKWTVSQEVLWRRSLSVIMCNKEYYYIIICASYKRIGYEKQ